MDKNQERIVVKNKRIIIKEHKQMEIIKYQTKYKE